MTLQEIQFIFNRALALSFSKKKLLFAFSVLALSGLLVVFFRGLAIEANNWVSMSLTFLPIFLCAAILMAMGVVLIRVYHDEVLKRDVHYWAVIGKSWELIIGASYFSIPIILCYLLLWMLLGIFFLLAEIPVFGPFFSVVLAFGPFLLNLGALLLSLLNVALLFFITPVIALRGMNRMLVSQILAKRFEKDLFSNLLLASIAIFPLLFFVGLLSLAAFITGSICAACDSPIYTILQWFFIMIPFTALLAPAVSFFFSFAAESHVLLQKKQLDLNFPMSHSKK